MKRIISLVLCITLCLFAFGCTNGTLPETPDEKNAQDANQPAQDAPETDKEEPSEALSEINVGALKGPTAMGLVKLMDDSDKGNTGSNKYTFSIAASPDEIVPLLVKGDLDMAAVPANLASVLYNNTKGKVCVVAINTLGVLYIVENGDSVKTVSDLKGKTIYSSGKGSTPEYALNYMLSSNGIDPEKDVTIEYKAEHSECVAAISAVENGIAMLPQPFVTTAQMANDKIRIALDLTKEWENASDCTLITGVMAASTDFVKQNPKAVKLFLEQYRSSVDYVNANNAEAAKLIENYGIVKAAVAEKALPYCNITCITGTDMKEQLASYIDVLCTQNPSAVGGEKPSDDFYSVGQ